MSDYFTNIVVCDFEYEVADGGLPNALCMDGVRAGPKLPARAHHSTVARRAFESDAAVRHRSQCIVRRLFRLGGDAMFHERSAGRSRSTSSTSTPPIWRQPIFCGPTIPKRSTSANANACRTRARPIGVTGWENIDKEDSEGHR